MKNRYIKTSGFTLIELSIVLVIIGLIIGGVLVGRDLIDAAAIRAQMSQIEKYTTAVKTFRLKYDYLPGDIPEPAASSYGLMARGFKPGQGDGNGYVMGSFNSMASPHGYAETFGESVVFWADLISAKLIDFGPSAASNTVPPAMNTTDVPNYFPAAKIGNNNFVYVWCDGVATCGNNYYSISQVTGNGGVTRHC